MNKENIIRAWKDRDFRNSLTEDELNSLPSNPAGMIDISDAELEMANGGNQAAITTPVCVTVTIGLGVTKLISCGPACTQTVNIGTCGFSSYGCCGSNFSGNEY